MSERAEHQGIPQLIYELVPAPPKWRAARVWKLQGKEGVRGAKMSQVYGDVTLGFHRFLKFVSRSCAEPKSCALETPQAPQASRHGLGTAPHPCLPQAEGALVVLTELP